MTNFPNTITYISTEERWTYVEETTKPKAERQALYEKTVGKVQLGMKHNFTLKQIDRDLKNDLIVIQ